MCGSQHHLIAALHLAMQNFVFKARANNQPSSHVTCHMSSLEESWVFSGKTLAYILLCKKSSKARKLEVSCGKKNQPAVNFQHTEISPPSITATSVALGFLGSLSSKLNSTWMEATNRKAGGKPARFWVNPTNPYVSPKINLLWSSRSKF